MVKVPVVWVQYSGAGNPCYNKVAGETFFVIGEEGENILLVTRPEQIFIPIFEAVATQEGDGREMILERMLALAECCVVETGKIGTIYGVFRSSHMLLNGAPVYVTQAYVTEVGLGCTASEFNPSDKRLSSEECEKFGLPWEVEINQQVIENHGTRA
jgi:hypothetical protein